MPDNNLMKDTEIPPEVMQNILNNQNRESSRREHKSWDEDDFSPQEYDDQEDDEIERDPDDDAPGANNAALGQLRSVMGEMSEQIRMINNNIGSIEINLSNIEKQASLKSEDADAAETASRITDALASYMATMRKDDEKRYSWFREDMIKNLFSQIDFKINVVNEKSQSWEKALEKIENRLAKKLFWQSIICSGIWAMLISIGIGVFYFLSAKIL